MVNPGLMVYHGATLQIYFPDVLLDMVDEMHGLRSIKLMVHISQWHMSGNHLAVKHRIAVAEFFRKVPSALEELDLEELTGDIPVSLFARFGRSLKGSDSTTVEMIRKWGHDQFSLSSTYMGSALAVPIWKSSKLTLMDGDWPHDILDKVAHFPRIKTLCLEIRPSGYECAKPYLSYYTSIQLYKYIASQRTSSPLTELVTLDDHHWSGLYDVASSQLGYYLRTYKAVSCRRFKDAHARALLDVWSSQIAGYRTDSTESFYGPVGGNTGDGEVIAMKDFANGLIQCGPRIAAYSGDGFSSAVVSNS